MGDPVTRRSSALAGADAPVEPSVESARAALQGPPSAGGVVPPQDPVTLDEDTPSPPPRNGSAAPSSPEGRDLAGALHEVSNALTVIVGWLGRARDLPVASPEELHRALDIATGRAAQARSIVRRAIGAEVDEEPPRSAGQVLREATLGLEPEASKAGVTLVVSVAPEADAGVVAAPSEAVQVLTNLLLNALAVSARGQSVRASVRPASGAAAMVVFSVEDEGPGVPEARRATLFLGGSTKRGGAGIGLRHAAARARALGGRLSLARGDGGARFELSWSAASAEGAWGPPPTREARSQRRSLDGARILILEDDAAVIDLLDTALTARGASVVSIRDRAHLDGALGTGPFQAALFDISPIQGDIKGALGAVRLRDSGTRVVLISGSAESMPPLPPNWVSAWVRKPFEIAEIVAALTRADPA